MADEDMSDGDSVAELNETEVDDSEVDGPEFVVVMTLVVLTLSRKILEVTRGKYVARDAEIDDVVEPIDVDCTDRLS